MKPACVIIPSFLDSQSPLVLEYCHSPEVLQVIDVEVRCPQLVDEGEVHVDGVEVGVGAEHHHPVVHPGELQRHAHREAEVRGVDLVDVEQLHGAGHLHGLAAGYTRPEDREIIPLQIDSFVIKILPFHSPWHVHFVIISRETNRARTHVLLLCTAQEDIGR